MLSSLHAPLDRGQTSQQESVTAASFQKTPRERSAEVAERGFLQPGSWKIPFLPARLGLAQPECKAPAKILGYLVPGGSWILH